MPKREAAFLNVFLAAIPFLLFVLAKGLAGKAEPAYALSAPDDYMLAFGVGITVLAALTSVRRRILTTRLFCQAVTLVLISACCYVSMTDHVDNNHPLSLWYNGMVVISMISSVLVAWQYLKAER